MGLQFTLAKRNSEKLFFNQLNTSAQFPLTCICPCSSIFRKWQKTHYLTRLPTFHPCENKVFDGPVDFVKHLHYKREDYYHRIIMRQVQHLYSSLIAKLKIPELEVVDKKTPTFQSIHGGRVSLPLYVQSKSNYITFTVERYVNIVHRKSIQYFFQPLLNQHFFFLLFEQEPYSDCTL